MKYSLSYNKFTIRPRDIKKKENRIKAMQMNKNKINILDNDKSFIPSKKNSSFAPITIASFIAAPCFLFTFEVCRHGMQ